MAEYCKECAVRELLLSPQELRRAVMSRKPELCEGCGEYRRVIIRIKPTLSNRWEDLGWKLREKIKK